MTTSSYLLGITACRPEKVIDLPRAAAKSAKSEALSMKAHPERAAGDIKTEGEKNCGDEKDNCAQDGTHCPKDGTEGGARYSQDGAEGGPRYSQNGTKGGPRYSQDGTKGRPRYSQDGTKGGPCCPQDGAKAYIANCVADSTAGSPPPRYLSNRY